MKSIFKNIFDDKRLFILSSVFGFFAGFSVVCGYQLEKYGNVDFYSPITYILIILSSVLGFIFFTVGLINSSRINLQKAKTLSSKKIILFYGIVVTVILIFWFPQLLGVYPGYFNYDADGQWFMYYLNSVTAHHPVIHTMVLGWILEFILNLTGSFNKAVFVFVFFQMLIIANCFSYVITYFYRKNFSKWFLTLSLAWFVAFPTVVINVLSITKDSLFGAFFTVFVTMSIELLESPEKRIKKPLFIISWCIITFLTAIMRNNAIYVMILFLPVLFYQLRKHWKKLLPPLGLLIVCYLVYTYIFCPLVTVDGISSKEFISVPAQQLMRVYHEKYSELNSTEIADYEILFNEVAREYYQPLISDNVKSNFNMEEFESNPSYYIFFYLTQGLKYPDVCINSFLHNTYGFWYPYASLILDSTGKEGYFVCHSRPPAVDDSKIPAIYNYYLLFENSSFVQGNSPIKILFLPGTYFWILMFVLANTIYTKQTEKSYMLFFVLLIWLTFLLGPVALVRYVSFLYFMTPLFFSLLSNNRKITK